MHIYFQIANVCVCLCPCVCARDLKMWHGLKIMNSRLYSIETHILQSQEKVTQNTNIIIKNMM